MDLTRTGHEMIEGLFAHPIDGRSHPKRRVETITVKDIVKEFFDLNVELVADEHYPGYLRCLNFSKQVEAYNALNDSRQQMFEIGEDNRFIADSTFRNALKDLFPRLLWLSDSHCPTCATYDEEMEKKPSMKTAFQKLKTVHKEQAKGLIRFAKNLGNFLC